MFSSLLSILRATGGFGSNAKRETFKPRKEHHGYAMIRAPARVGPPIEWIIDTGSGDSVSTFRTVERLASSRRRPYEAIDLEFANAGRTVATSSSCVDLAVTFVDHKGKEVALSVTARLVENASLEGKVLLGVDFLKREKMHIVWADKKGSFDHLAIGKRKIRLELKEE